MKGKKRKRKNKLFSNGRNGHIRTTEHGIEFYDLTPEQRVAAQFNCMFINRAVESILSGEPRHIEPLRVILKRLPHQAALLDEFITTAADCGDEGKPLMAAYQSHIVNPGSMN